MAIQRTSKDQLKNATEGRDDMPSATPTAKTKSFKGEVSEWTRADSEMSQRLILLASAPQKSGKTHFGLTAPAKKKGKRSGLGVFNFDIGLEGVVQKFQHDKEIHVCDCRLDIPRAGAKGWSQKEMEATADSANRIWEKFLDRYQYALEHFRSIVIDTGTELWELHRLARFGKLEQVKPHHYGPVNAEHRELFRMAYDTDVNLIYIQKMKDEYANDQRTGRLKSAGFSDAPYQSQANVRLGRIRDEDSGVVLFSATIDASSPENPWGGCRLNPEVEGLVFTQPDCSFSDVAQAILTDSNAKDWE